MTGTDKADYAITIGRFADGETEARYRAYELDTSQHNLRIVMPLLGLLFLAFCIPDGLAFGPGRVSQALFAVRASFFVAMVAISRFMAPSTPLLARELLLGGATAAGIAAFAYTAGAYRDMNVYLQALSVMLMLSAEYLIPNRFWFSIAASVATTALCLRILSSGRLPPTAYALLVCATDFALISAFSAGVWLKTCRARRREYAQTMELSRLSMTDQLTGLPNRRYLSEKLGETYAHLIRYGEETSLILVDLDRFKSLNDSFGHEAGDAALRETAARLSSVLRQGDSVSRWGGEEFVVLLPHTNLEAAYALAERLRQCLRDTPMPLVGTVTASFGLSSLCSSDGPDDAIARADKALYRAKETGRDRIEVEP